MSHSPIEQFLDALDRLELEATMALMAHDARVLVADGRRAEGKEAVRQLFGEFLGQLRSTTHRITAQWHEDDVWIAEVDASYELRDWLQLNALPRAFIVRAGPDGISELRAYGAREHRLSDHPPGEEGMRVGGRWVPPLSRQPSTACSARCRSRTCASAAIERSGTRNSYQADFNARERRRCAMTRLNSWLASFGVR